MRKNIDITTSPAPEQIELLAKAQARSLQADADCPELSAEDLARFKKISEARQSGRQKQTVTLRLSPQALKTAKSLGKGYTSVLSRILENALSDPEIIMRNL